MITATPRQGCTLPAGQPARHGASLETPRLRLRGAVAAVGAKFQTRRISPTHLSILACKAHQEGQPEVQVSMCADGSACSSNKAQQQDRSFPTALQQLRQQVAQGTTPGQLREASDAPWAAAWGVLQHGLVLAAASCVVLSMCLSAPAASSARAVQQPYQQQRQHQQQDRLVLTVQQQQPLPFLMGSSTSTSSTSSTYLHHQAGLVKQQQQQQQQQQLVTWQRSSTSSSRVAFMFPQQLQQQQQLEQQQPQTQQQEVQQQLQFELSSQIEDGMLEGMRQLEAGMDRAFGALSSGLHMVDAAQASSEQSAVAAQAEALINEVWEVVDNNYLDARRSGFDHEKWAHLRDEAVSRTYYDMASVHRAVRDMLAQGVSDPYCRFIEPSEFASMKKYDVTGVGLNLGTGEEFTKKTGLALPRVAHDSTPSPSSAAAADGGVWVVGISRGSEADRAGIQQGDQLLAVAGVPLGGVSPFQAATLIAGPDDSSVSTTVDLRVRKVDGSMADVTVLRPARVLASPVTSSLQQRYISTNGGAEAVGVIRLTSFNARALRDVSAALQQLQDQGVRELVLDLRDNRGGLVSEGLEVARLFLSDGVPIVLTQSKAMAAAPPRAGSTAATQLPLTVLVNEHTASASEILAGAIKDNCRGVLVGKRTYGKGLIQSVYELSDTSGLVITVGKYLTPRGVDIDRFGIAPDFRSLPDPREAEAALDACRLEASALSGGGSTPSASVSRSGGGAEGGAQQQRVLAGAVPAG